jgi:hypothetical protein
MLRAKAMKGYITNRSKSYPSGVWTMFNFGMAYRPSLSNQLPCHYGGTEVSKRKTAREWLALKAVTGPLPQSAATPGAVSPADIAAIDKLVAGTGEAEYAKPEDFVTFKQVKPNLFEPEMAKGIEKMADDWMTQYASQQRLAALAALPPLQTEFPNCGPDSFPQENFCYEVQTRRRTSSPFNDGWTDWMLDVRHPARYSTARRAANRIQRRLKDGDSAVRAHEREWRVEPVYLGHVPDFKWERNKPVWRHPRTKRTAMRTATGSNLLLSGSYHN